MCHNEQQQTTEPDPRQQIGIDLLDSIREKAIDAASVRFDKAVRAIEPILAEFLDETPVKHNDGFGIREFNSRAASALITISNAFGRLAERWRPSDDGGPTFNFIIAQETRRITDAIASAAANSVVPVEGTIGGPGQCCRQSPFADKPITPAELDRIRQHVESQRPLIEAMWKLVK